MPTLIRTLRLLCIVIWVGGILFFAFVLAPVAFRVLPSQHLAGLVVGGTLRVLDILGIVSGFIFCAATTLLSLYHPLAETQRLYQAQLLIATIMLFGTAYLHVGILPAMEIDRAAAGGNIESASANDPARIHFEKLHKRSERTEGAILFCGLAIVILIARESLPTGRLESV